MDLSYYIIKDQSSLAISSEGDAMEFVYIRDLSSSGVLKEVMVVEFNLRILENGKIYKISMNLNLKDRVILLKTLPTTGSLQEMQEVYSIVGLIKITLDEKEQYNYIEKDGAVYWNTEIDSNKEFDLSKDQIALIKSCITKLDQEKKIQFQELETFLKFIK